MERISDIIESIANEKNLDIEDVKERVKRALINTAKHVYGHNYEYDVAIDTNKTIKLYQKTTIIYDDDERLEEDNEHFISLKEARNIDNSVEVGDELTYELSLDNLGRTAAQTLHKELEYHIQRLVEDKIFEKYNQMQGQIVFGTVVRVDEQENTFIEIEELRAILPRKNRIKGENFKVGNVVKAVIRKVFADKNLGIKVELSRTSPRFLDALLKAEVPEINDGGIIIQNSARIPGERAKVALSSVSPMIDPIGATVGTKGVRINAVSKELNNENIDVVEYSSEPVIFITRAMSPAIINSVTIEGQKAIVSLVSEQKSKAIGKSGINIRLASMLTGYEIELRDLGASSSESQESNTMTKDLKALFGDL
ncbi:transcription termination factor NusA [Campylobacter pinnipediorum]|uniref:Transcription termination/antitermination protein NusA n=1 Tax=Campylobacter pinnipediorum subsp. pinnipediorum TaxID=1660067 RepID=A0AAX0LBL8_9BACT|nr:transcription termination factor NusA [Campylobacter pinnipediorum]AQW81578.1 transcription termination factor [Campylobacter pinnipediorum subsp. pinnipediorum]AQW83206.1 transcription termination factor [Campylobacter pinnipediorum subsp. pinnipediorum]OPA79638.1 transcription termination factor NusA [Campylobacter pinnipediorum subsp. pinnipediorum]OPA81759.1 transcription termination factor NusA [Campylobacter pinnipediorum subsp. pinnipediorum]